MLNYSRFQSRLLIALCLACLCAACAHGDVIHVKTTGDDANSGSTWEDAKLTIQAAVDAADPGDDVWVAEGTYSFVRLRKEVALRGGYAGEGSVRDIKAHTTDIRVSSTSSPAAVILAGEAVLDGFTIYGGSSCVRCESGSPVVSDNVMQGLQGVSCYGVEIEDGSPLISGNLFMVGLSAVQVRGGAPVIQRNRMVNRGGAGVYCTDATAWIDRNAFYECDPAVWCEDSVDVRITNNKFVANRDVVRCIHSSAEIVNNTIAWNKENGIYCFHASAVVANNIIAFNKGTGVYVDYFASALLVNNDVYGNWWNYIRTDPGPSDIQADPQFAGPEFGDIHLRPTSPCRDAGATDTASIPDYDLEGKPRPYGPAPDIGAMEWSGEDYPDPYQPRVIYVDASAAPGGDGTAWETAYRLIRLAAEDVMWDCGAEIWVAQGEYSEGITLPRHARLYGGFASGDAKEDRDPKAKVATINPASGLAIRARNEVVVDGLTIRAPGGGIRCALESATITNNVIIIDGRKGSTCYGIHSINSSSIITGNLIVGKSPYGPRGVWHRGDGSPVITHNTFVGNETAVYACDNDTEATVANNVIAGNEVGIRCCSGSTITNNTIVRNIRRGIDYLGDANEATISNNIVAFNGTGIHCDDDAPLLTYNDVFGNDQDYYPDTTPHLTDMSTDPLFASVDYTNFHIQPDSPCRDAGDGSVPGIPDLDMDGQARVDGPAIDIGADESHGELYPIPYLPRVIHVDAAAPHGGDGTSWVTAFTSLEQAMDDVRHHGGAQVWAAQGEYGEQLRMQPFAYIYGGFASGDDMADRAPRSKVTTIDPGSTESDVYAVTGANLSSIDGFTIRGGQYGVSCIYSSPTITNNIISGSARGVHVYNSSPAIRCNRICDTATSVYVDCRFTGTPIVAGNLLTASSTGAYLYNGSAVLTNNTVAGNLGDGISVRDGSATIANNIVAFNSTGISNSDGILSLSHNDVYGNGTDYSANVGDHSADISENPQFASLDYADFHIRPTSPCRDAGDNSAPGVPDFDMDGQPRPEGPAVDIGADESHGEDYPDPYPARVLYVNCEAPPGGDGTTWETAFQSIQEAVDVAEQHGPAQVWVAQGVYHEEVYLHDFTHVYGGFAVGDAMEDRDPKAKPTIVQHDGTLYHDAFTGAHICTIDGFVIRGATGGTAFFSTYGFTRIRNCIIYDNLYGIFCLWSAPNISNTVVTDNVLDGVYLSGCAANIVNCVVAANGGSGLYLRSSSPVVVNSTIVDNAGSGVLCAKGSAPVLTNNIVAFNSVGIEQGSLAPVLSHNDVYGNADADYAPSSMPHPTDISADPLFVNSENGDYHILPGSLCIDAGTSDGAPDADLDGNYRPKDGDGDGTAIFDIGCYEAPNNYVSVAGAKAVEDGSLVGITSCVSTAAFWDRFYVENVDRACGIGVLANVESVGKYVTVEGTMTTLDGERLIDPALTQEHYECPVPAPWFMTLNSLGGGPCGLQEGVTDRRMGQGEGHKSIFSYGGASNIGLLVKVTGRVGKSGDGFFYIDGQSGFRDGRGKFKGVRVDWPFTEPAPRKHTFVEIVGISSCTIRDGCVVRLLRPVSADSVRSLH